VRKVRPHQATRVGDYRYLRALPVELNMRRLKVHLQRLRQRLLKDVALRRMRLQKRRRARAASNHQ
jgi:hypothetical protein